MHRDGTGEEEVTSSSGTSLNDDVPVSTSASSILCLFLICYNSNNMQPLHRWMRQPERGSALFTRMYATGDGYVDVDGDPCKLNVSLV